MPDNKKNEHLLAEIQHRKAQLKLLEADVVAIRNRMAVRIAKTKDINTLNKIDDLLLRLVNKDVLIAFLEQELAEIDQRPGVEPAPVEQRLKSIADDIRRLAASVNRMRTEVEEIME